MDFPYNLPFHLVGPGIALGAAGGFADGGIVGLITPHLRREQLGNVTHDLMTDLVQPLAQGTAGAIRLVMGPHQPRIVKFLDRHAEVMPVTGHMWLDWFEKNRQIASDPGEQDISLMA